MMLQHSVRQSMSDQFDRADLLIGTGIHFFQHLTGNFSLVVVVQLLVYTGDGFDVS